MPPTPELPRAERLAVDIDTRIADIWALAWDRDTLIGYLMDGNDDLAESVGLLMRAAYGKGYCDAFAERRNGGRSELARVHGYRRP